CDIRRFDGSVRPRERRVKTYSTALRMRAALIYSYGLMECRGHKHWVQVESGQWAGNPAISLVVAKYITSLRREKTAVTARSLA
ncbi:hypothetical protein C8T65DRAFT_586092, partial [Cerioporus squamosus]